MLGDAQPTEHVDGAAGEETPVSTEDVVAEEQQQNELGTQRGRLGRRNACHAPNIVAGRDIRQPLDGCNIRA
ncbi:hypothetical protein Vau01_084370 [Virgisporangium aurantiacum]|uniref:Uncharacterized protein n=1 Tax=Virgisporangium aurantiacum TaxID=175570 RepID=A0A8J3ZG12_9ACTN|nr:hypothetical protein Vau01_084370 [Virgisporangium aurantiacum]